MFYFTALEQFILQVHRKAGYATIRLRHDLSSLSNIPLQF